METQREPERKEIQHPDRKAQGEEQIEKENGCRENPHQGKTRHVALSGFWEAYLQGVAHHDIRRHT